MRKIKISVIVPVYNVEKYIKECMDSLVEQTFEDYEIIVVDDGTPDNSMDYVLKLQKVYENIIVVRRENGGLSAARNTGLEYARGEYVLFCDSDDSLDRNCLSLLYNEAVNKKLDLLLFDLKVFKNIDGEWYEIENCYGRRNIIMDNIMTGQMLFSELVKFHEYKACSVLYLIKSDIIKINNLRFYEGIVHEDELFTPIILAVSERVEHRNWPLYRRYERPGSIMQSGSIEKKAEGLYYVIKELEKWRGRTRLSSEMQVALIKVIQQHIQQFLFYCSMMHHITEKQKKQRSEIIKITRQNYWKTEIIFKFYLIKERLKVCLKMVIGAN